jgi:hypothetical protein
MEVLTEEEQESELTLLPSSTISDNDRQIVTSPWQSRVHARDLFTGRKSVSRRGGSHAWGGAVCCGGDPPA